MRRVAFILLIFFTLSGGLFKKTSPECIEKFERAIAILSGEIKSGDLNEINVGCSFPLTDAYGLFLYSKYLQLTAMSESGLEEAAKYMKLAAGKKPLVFPIIAGETITSSWFVRAMSDANAQYELALMYMRGRGVEQSDKKAKKWLKRATKRLHPKAEVLFAELYPEEYAKLKPKLDKKRKEQAKQIKKQTENDEQ